MAASIVKTDWGKVPRYQKDSLARALVKAMEAFYLYRIILIAF